MDQQEQFYSRINQFKTGMLTTISSEGAPHARPMTVARLDEDCSVWLLTSDPSEKANESRSEPIATLSFQREPDLYVVINGLVRVAHDLGTAHQLWNEKFRPWFPDGPDDPMMAVLSLTPHNGEYWDNAGGSRIRSAYEFVRDAITGTKTYTNDQEEHVKAQLS
jgi:general stress protein 26